MSDEDKGDDYVNEDNGDSSLDAGDSREKEKKSEPNKKQTKPPVRPRPPTARGKRTPFDSGSFQPDAPRYGDGFKTRGNVIGASVEDDGNSSSITPGSSGSTSQYKQEPSDIPSTSSGRYGGTSTSNRSFVQQVSPEEMMIGEQARLLLNLFIQDRAENTSVEPIIRDVCQADRTVLGHGLSDESLSDIAITLRRIGDEISQDVDLNNFIEQVPIHSTREIFMKVCLQIFQDGNLNWGRIVVLFYFAYRLIIRTITKGMDNVPWIRDLITWAVEFIVKHVAKWIYNRGGWTMIKEWFGISNQTWMLLSAGSLAVILWALFKKD